MGVLPEPSPSSGPEPPGNQSDLTSTSPGRATAGAADFVERYLLSAVFLCLAGVGFYQLRTNAPAPFDVNGMVFAGMVRQFIRLLLDLLVGVLLLVGRRVAVPPREAKDILIPLVATFYTLAYNLVEWFPPWLQEHRCAPALQTPLAAAGLTLGMIGLAVAIWSVWSLGRSYGVFVVVRQVTLGGAYRWVRHPMYLGYILLCASLVVANVSLAYFILVPAHVFLLVYRARLEEARLSACSPEYREYRKHTGFIIPMLGRSR